jgi:hypothetical protein
MVFALIGARVRELSVNRREHGAETSRIVKAGLLEVGLARNSPALADEDLFLSLGKKAY